jgi:8-oxo-dGTP pyrophosphatase MutT (NUDIX family)
MPGEEERTEEGPQDEEGGEIPDALLPPGFLETLQDPPDIPVPTRAASTVVLLRKGREGSEVLLLQRARSSGFVPGAWVFPGGRVDPEDSDPRLLPRLGGLEPEEAARRLGLFQGVPPAIAYYMASVREAFEETGLWPGSQGPDPASPRVAEAREALLAGSAGFPEVMEELDLHIPGRNLEYIAHWITPVVEPRRYDTRFFAAVVDAGREARIDAREMTGALWLSPEDALERNLAGDLPMVFPTLHTLRQLAGGAPPEVLLERFRGQPVPAILPRLVRTPTGVSLRFPR